MPLKKTCTLVYSEIPCSKNSYHVETSQLISLQINRPVSIGYDFLLKSLSKQILITATVINCRKRKAICFKSLRLNCETVLLLPR